MDTFGIGYVGDQFRILVSGLGICTLARYVCNRLAMLALISRDHIDRLLQQVEIPLLIAVRWSRSKVAVYKSLGAGIKERVYVTLIPASLFDWLKFAIEIIKPLAYVALIGL